MKGGTIPVSVIVVTKNEEPHLARCLAALSDFSEVIVVDSGSADNTAAIARQAGVRVVDFMWNGRYPKKRQWCLDHLELAHEWVFFVDADEVVPPDLVMEIRRLDFAMAGYFVKGRYVVNGKVLRRGLQNNKLCLFDRRKIEFPVVDDLDLPGMGEIEGHYQPVLKKSGAGEAPVGQLKTPLLHYAFDDPRAWERRHQGYALWEAGMIARKAYPRDPVPAREVLKGLFRAMRLRPVIAFLHCYIVKAGFLDGREGLLLAQSRHRYYRMLT